MIKWAVRGEAGDVDRLLGNRHSDPDPGEETDRPDRASDEARRLEETTSVVHILTFVGFVNSRGGRASERRETMVLARRETDSASTDG